MIYRPQLASLPIPLLLLLCGVGARILTYITSLSAPGADSLGWCLFPRVKQSDWPSDSAWKEERCVGLGRSHSTPELLSAGQGSTHRQGCRSLRTIQVGRTEVQKFWFLRSGPALTQNALCICPRQWSPLPRPAVSCILFSFPLGCKPWEAGTLPTNRAYVSLIEGRNEKSPGQRELEAASGGEGQEAESRAAGCERQALSGCASWSSPCRIREVLPLRPRSSRQQNLLCALHAIPDPRWLLSSPEDLALLLGSSFRLVDPGKSSAPPAFSQCQQLLHAPHLPLLLPPTPNPGSRPTILLAKQNVLGSVFCWPDPGIPVPKTLLLARLLSPKSWSGSFFPWGQTFLWLLVPPASTQRTKHVAPSRRFHSWPSCCLQMPSGPALASGCFLPPQSLVSEKGGPWWRPGKPGSWWGRDPSVVLAFLLSGTHAYQSLRWNASMKRIFCSWGCAPCSVTVKVTSDQWHPTHDMLRPHLRAQLTESSGTLWTPCVRVTTVPVRDDYQMIHWPQKYKVLQRNNCVFPKSTENGPFLPCFA